MACLEFVSILSPCERNGTLAFPEIRHWSQAHEQVSKSMIPCNIEHKSCTVGFFTCYLSLVRHCIYRYAYSFFWSDQIVRGTSFNGTVSLSLFRLYINFYSCLTIIAAHKQAACVCRCPYTVRGLIPWLTSEHAVSLLFHARITTAMNISSNISRYYNIWNIWRQLWQ